MSIFSKTIACKHHGHDKGWTYTCEQCGYTSPFLLSNKDVAEGNYAAHVAGHREEEE